MIKFCRNFVRSCQELFFVYLDDIRPISSQDFAWNVRISSSWQDVSSFAYHGVSSLVSLVNLSMCFLLESLPLRYCCLQTLHSIYFPQPTTFSVANHFKTTRNSDCTKSDFSSLPRWRSQTDAGYVETQNERAYLFSVRHLSLGGAISAMNNR